MPEIDGLRGLAILFVLAGHTGDPIWTHVHGTGVPIFFLNSGFLITLLLLREETVRGRVDIVGFYVRRAFRLLPVYFVALGLYTGLVLLGLAENAGDWWARFALFVTFQNEFAPFGTFGHTWTLAMQEKFYIVWPLFAFSLISPLFRRGRLWLAVAISAMLTVAWMIWPDNYTAPFLPLMLGCILALLMFDERGYRLVGVLSSPIVFCSALIAAVLLKVYFGQLHDVSVPFAYLFLLLMPGLVVGPQWMGAPLRKRFFVAIGTWAYSMYLLHPIVFSAIQLFDPSGQPSVGAQLLRYLLLVSVTSAVGFVSYRLIERPGIELGARFARRRARLRAHPSTP